MNTGSSRYVLPAEGSWPVEFYQCRPVLDAVSAYPGNPGEPLHGKKLNTTNTLCKGDTLKLSFIERL